MDVTYDDGKLVLWLSNHARSTVTFTVTHHNYSSARPHTVKLRPHDKEQIKISQAWYDVTVTSHADAAWSQRFTGHLETGKDSITG